jgi:hypothetical protein
VKLHELNCIRQRIVAGVETREDACALLHEVDSLRAVFQSILDQEVHRPGVLLTNILDAARAALER